MSHGHVANRSDRHKQGRIDAAVREIGRSADRTRGTVQVKIACDTLDEHVDVGAVQARRRAPRRREGGPRREPRRTVRFSLSKPQMTMVKLAPKLATVTRLRVSFSSMRMQLFPGRIITLILLQHAER